MSRYTNHAQADCNPSGRVESNVSPHDGLAGFLFQRVRRFPQLFGCVRAKFGHRLVVLIADVGDLFVDRGFLFGPGGEEISPSNGGVIDVEPQRP